MKHIKKIPLGNNKYLNTPLYRRYWGILTRCYNKNDKSYHRYGGRGIGMCDEWRSDFQSFADWAIKNGYKEGLQIDRINNNGDYNPSNCRFVTNRVNGQNTRTFTHGVSWFKGNKCYRAQIKFNGEKICLGYFKNRDDGIMVYARASLFAEIGIHPKTEAEKLIRLIEVVREECAPHGKDCQCQLCLAYRDQRGGE